MSTFEYNLTLRSWRDTYLCANPDGTFSQEAHAPWNPDVRPSECCVFRAFVPPQEPNSGPAITLTTAYGTTVSVDTMSVCPRPLPICSQSNTPSSPPPSSSDNDGSDTQPARIITGFREQLFF